MWRFRAGYFVCKVLGLCFQGGRAAAQTWDLGAPFTSHPAHRSCPSWFMEMLPLLAKVSSMRPST